MLSFLEPTYGSLIDLLQYAEVESGKTRKRSAVDILYDQFQIKYPHISIGRPKRLYDTAKRVSAPTQSSLKLSGSALDFYRRRKWIPRIRNPSSTKGT